MQIVNQLSMFAVVAACVQTAWGGALGDYLSGREKTVAEWQMLNHYERWQAGKEGLADYPYLPKLVKMFERNYGGKPNPMPIPEEPGRELLAAGARVGEVPLHSRAVLLSPWLCRELIAAGADVNARDAEGCTPLHIAARWGYAEACRLLLAAGAELEAEDAKGLSPLAAAFRQSKPEVCRLLLEAGAGKRGFRCGDAPGALYGPIGPPEMPGVDVQGSFVLYNLMGDVEMCQRLLAAGASLGERPHFRLVYAIAHGYVEWCRALLDTGMIDVNMRQYDNSTWLHDAASWRHPNAELCKLFLPLGVNTRNDRGETPLHELIPPHSLDFVPPMDKVEAVCKLLVEAGADVNARNKAGQTPLLRACERRSELFYTQAKEEWKICSVLLQYGADANAADAKGHTPLYYALLGTDAELCRELLKAGAVPDALPPLAVYALAGDAESCRRCLVEGANPNAAFEEAPTPLFLAAHAGRADICELLLAAGAEPNCGNEKNPWRLAPIHIAAQQGNAEVCRLLLAAGADVNAPDSSDYKLTPLHFAVSRRHADVCRILLAAGADPNRCDITTGYSPLHSAADKGHEEICRMLLAAGADASCRTSRGKFLPLDFAREAGHAYLLDLLTPETK